VPDAGSYTVTVKDSLGQVVTSRAAILTVGTPGTGTGLLGAYYSSQLMTFIEPPTLIRVEPTVDFDWVANSPDPGISADTFTARWSGQVQPFYSQTYTFTARTDDGVRVWVNGQLVVDSWVNQAATERSGNIGPLVANQKYNILMEYFENTGNALAQLFWSSPSQPKQIIPQSQLYPSAVIYQPSLATALLPGGGPIVLTWAGSYGLQSTTNLINPTWEAVTGATSPYTNAPASGGERYFRLISQ